MSITEKVSMQKINMQQTEKERDQEGCKSRHGLNEEENHLNIDHIGQRLHMSYCIKGRVHLKIKAFFFL